MTPEEFAAAMAEQDFAAVADEMFDRIDRSTGPDSVAYRSEIHGPGVVAQDHAPRPPRSGEGGGSR